MDRGDSKQDDEFVFAKKSDICGEIQRNVTCKKHLIYKCTASLPNGRFFKVDARV